MARILGLLLIALVVWLALGPRSGGDGPGVAVTLAQLAADPARWDGRRITVTAQVIDRATVMGMGGVLIGDAAGNRILAAGWTGPASPGATATVSGEYRLALAVGEVQVPLILIVPPPVDRG